MKLEIVSDGFWIFAPQTQFFVPVENGFLHPRSVLPTDTRFLAEVLSSVFQKHFSCSTFPYIKIHLTLPFSAWHCVSFVPQSKSKWQMEQETVLEFLEQQGLNTEGFCFRWESFFCPESGKQKTIAYGLSQVQIDLWQQVFSWINPCVIKVFSYGKK